MTGDALAWRVEAACREAWPCDREIARDGWLIRASGGSTRRTNSVNPLPGARADIATILAEARAAYAAIGKPLLFRVPDLAGEMDAALTRLGIGPGEGATATLHAVLADCPRDAAGAARVGALDEAWLAARARLIGWNDAEMHVYRRMLGLTAGPTAFAAVRDGDGIAAVAYGAITQGLLVVESVVTAAESRRRGFARQVVAALLDWGRGQGVDQACLQVTASNIAALQLYRGLGFARELYRYHYRQAA